MELPIIIRLCVKDFIMVVSSVFNFVFQLPDGTPHNHSLICERFSRGRFMIWLTFMVASDYKQQKEGSFKEPS